RLLRPPLRQQRNHFRHLLHARQAISQTGGAMTSPAAAELHQMASIGRLLAGIVHEINTPLGSVFSNTEVILRSLEMLDPLLGQSDEESIEKARRIVGTCRSLASVDRIACERIRSVIRGLKSFARVDSTERRAVDLNQQ